MPATYQAILDVIVEEDLKVLQRVPVDLERPTVSIRRDHRL